jgi:hypothetical protein
MKRNVEKVWGARYTLGARYLSKNTVIQIKKDPLHTISLSGYNLPITINT